MSPSTFLRTLPPHKYRKDETYNNANHKMGGARNKVRVKKLRGPVKNSFVVMTQPNYDFTLEWLL